MRILLVEDNADHRELMSLTLMGHDATWQVEEVASGGEALRCLAEGEAYDLVFLDYSLPERDGLEVLEEIQRGEAPPPVVMVTGLGDEEVAVEAMKGGAYDYVVKGTGYLQPLPAVAQWAVEAHQLAVERQRAEEEFRRSCAALRRSLEGMVNVLVSTVEIRDSYTAEHQRRVAQLACAIADEMGLPEEQIEGIRTAGLIYDLGKLSIPLEILNKPGGLTELEQAMIKGHPQVSYDVLKTVGFPWPVAQIVLQHHEMLDGSGYPQGLSDEAILLEARILAVADVVTAMSCHRPNGGPWGMDRALEEISQNRGGLYDPEMVDACLKLFAEKGFEFE